MGSRCNEIGISERFPGLTTGALRTIIDMTGALPPDDANDWVVTQPDTGDPTFANICHVDTPWTWADDSVHLAGTSGNSEVGIDTGYAEDQRQIAAALLTLDVPLWNRSAFSLLGEFQTIASHMQSPVFDHYRLGIIRRAVDARGTDPFERFFSLFSPDTTSAEMALRQMHSLGSVSGDREMVRILMAGWHVLRAETASDAIAQNHLYSAMSFVKLVIGGDYSAANDASYATALDNITASTVLTHGRKSLMKWVVEHASALRPSLFAPPPPPPPPPPRVTAEQCLAKTDDRNRHTFVVNPTGTACVPCETDSYGRQMITTDGTTCVERPRRARAVGSAAAVAPTVAPTKAPPASGRGVSNPWR